MNNWSKKMTSDGESGAFSCVFKVKISSSSTNLLRRSV